MVGSRLCRVRYVAGVRRVCVCDTGCDSKLAAAARVLSPTDRSTARTTIILLLIYRVHNNNNNNMTGRVRGDLRAIPTERRRQTNLAHTIIIIIIILMTLRHWAVIGICNANHLPSLMMINDEFLWFVPNAHGLQFPYNIICTGSFTVA